MSEKSPKSQTVYEIITEMQRQVDKLEKNLKLLEESNPTDSHHIEMKKENIKRLENELGEIRRPLEILKNLSWIRKK